MGREFAKTPSPSALPPPLPKGEAFKSKASLKRKNVHLVVGTGVLDCPYS